MADQICAHLRNLPDPEPEALTPEGCEECLTDGTKWVHLRKCLACGHIGCCDSSPGQHASHHSLELGHPAARSFEPGENWAWCYADEMGIEL